MDVPSTLHFPLSQSLLLLTQGPGPTPPRALVMAAAALEITHLQNPLSHLIEVGPGTGRHSGDTSPPPSPLFPLGPETPGLARYGSRSHGPTAPLGGYSA